MVNKKGEGVSKYQSKMEYIRLKQNWSTNYDTNRYKVQFEIGRKLNCSKQGNAGINRETL